MDIIASTDVSGSPQGHTTAESLPVRQAPESPVCTCGAGPHPTDVERCARGHLRRDNVTSRKHGLYAVSLARELAAERDAFLAASLTDDGGEADVPTRRRALHAYRARLHVHIAQLSDALEQLGLFDSRGRLRAAWLSRLEGLIGRAQQIDSTLGLERQSKQIPSSPLAYLEQLRQEGKHDA